MVRKDIINDIAKNTGFTKQDSDVFLTAFAETVINALAKGEKVQIVGFGAFEVRDRAEKIGTNPQTGEKQTYPAYKACVFKSSKNIKETINA